MIKKIFIIFCLITQVFISVAQKISSFPLNKVELLDGSAFYEAQQADMKYILALDPDRLLAPYLKEASINPSKPNYPNWESMGLDGHTVGHYLSALSLMYASTGQKKLMERIQYVLKILDSCQIKNGDGYVGGVPDGKALWNDIRNGKIDAGSFSLGNRWVPFYNLHKLFAGLRDAYLYAGQSNALEILIKLTDWFYDLTKNLTDEQTQQILKTEHGGLNEVFVNVSEITGNPKYLKLAERFSHRAILQPLIEKKDILTGLHANTQIPKVIGFKSYADATNNTQWDEAAKYFWDLVVNKYTISIGGHGVREHFISPNDFSSMIESNQGPETCNSYNMLKLTKLLFLSTSDTKYIDFYERTLYNHILSTINRQKGGLVYFTPMHPCHYRVYSTVENSFWCCVGTGMENHAKYGEIIYSFAKDTLFVNLFINSRLQWDEKRLKILQQTNFPYQSFTKLSIDVHEPVLLTIKIRKPKWIKENYLTIKINNQKPVNYIAKNGFVSITRKWEKNDTIIVQLPQNLSIEYLPDGSSWASILYGPIVLASACDTSNQKGLWADDSRMAHVANGLLYPIDEYPCIISEHKDFSKKIRTVDQSKLIFSVEAFSKTSKKTSILLRPFFELAETRYTVYFPVASKEEFKKQQILYDEKEKKRIEIENRTIDQIAPGEQQSEVGHNFKGENTEWGINQNRFWRHAYGWFSYDLYDKNHEAKSIQLTFFGQDSNRNFDVLINDIKVTTIVLKGDKGDRFFDVEFFIPENLLKHANKVYTIKFVPSDGSIAGGVYNIRLLK